MNDERAAAGVEHLQAAALELIEAARAFLDVAEDLVRDPGVAATIVQTAAGVGRAVMGAGDRPPPDAGSAAQGGRVHRIHVS